MLEYTPDWYVSVSWILYLAFVVSFFVAFGMGANDCANSYGTVVGAHVLKLWQAYLLATFFELLGASLLGYRVTETMQKSIVNLHEYDVYSHWSNRTNEYVLVPAESCHSDRQVPIEQLSSNGTGLLECTKYTSLEFMLGELGVLIGTAAWLLIATIFHAPVSTTHSAVGATVGFALVIKGSRGANFMQIIQIVISWIASPALAGFFAVVIYVIVRQTVFSREHPFECSLRMLPIFYFTTLMVNLFSVLYGGSKYLKLNTLTWWHCTLISFLCSSTVALVMQFYGVKRISQRIRRRFERRKKLQDQSCPTEMPTDLFDVTIQVLPVSKSVKQEIELKSSIADGNVEGGIVFDYKCSDNSEADEKNANGTNHDEATKVDRPPAAADDEQLSGNKRKVRRVRSPMSEDPMAQEVFNYLQILSACFLSFSHGSNDTANAVGPLVAIWCTTNEGRADMSVVNGGVLELLILFGGVSMIIGLWVLGHKVISTIGTKLTEVTSPSGFAMELGTAFTVLFASKFGIPISTTHCAVGAVVCVGWMRSSTAGVSWKTFRNIAIAWLITLPVSGSIAALVSWLLISNVRM